MDSFLRRKHVKSFQLAAVFKGASTGASVYAAIELPAQIPVSFSMQQGRKYHLGELLLRCMVILSSCLSICLGMAILDGNPAEFICRVANLERSLWRERRPDGTFQPIAQGGVLYSQYREKFKLEILNESSASNTSYLQTLTLKEATVDDNGEYRCEEEGHIRYSTSLTVESPGLAILEGNPAKFSCRVATLETSLWRVQRPDGTFQAFAQGGVLYSQYREKFKLKIRNESSRSSTTYLQTLTLNKATVDDDGEYRCEEEGQIRSLTTLTVESTPVLHLGINNNTVTTTNIDVVLNMEVAVDCIAEGGKPSVTLFWWVNGEEVNGRLIDNPPYSPERVTSTIHLFPTMGDKSLVCVARGQKVTPQTNVSVGLNIQYLNCSLEVVKIQHDHVLNCTCAANPDVETKEIYVNSSSHSGKSVKLPCDEPADVFCKASSAAFTSITKEDFLRPFCFGGNKEGSKAGLVIVSVAAVILALIVIIHFIRAVYRKCQKKAEERKVENHQKLTAQWTRKKGGKTRRPDHEAD